MVDTTQFPSAEEFIWFDYNVFYKHRLDGINFDAARGLLNVDHHIDVVIRAGKMQQEAYDRLRDLKCPTRPLHTTESEAYYDFYFDSWIRLSGIRERLVQMRLRHALRRLEYRCLRKAYAPGQSAMMRAVSENERMWDVC